jgi:hypothetical protein
MEKLESEEQCPVWLGVVQEAHDIARIIDVYVVEMSDEICTSRWIANTVPYVRRQSRW